MLRKQPLPVRFPMACVRLGSAMALVFGFGWGAEPGFAADYQYPLAVTASKDAVFVADRNLPGVWSIADGKPTLFFEGSKMFRTPLNAVRCLTADREGRLIAGDSSTRQVYRFEHGAPVPLLKTKIGIGIPMGLAVDRQNNIVVSDLETQRLCRIPPGEDAPIWFAEVPAPRGLTIDEDERIWVVSHGPDQLLRVGPDGKSEVIVAGRPFQFPNGVAIDDRMAAYVADGYAKTIWKIDGDGKPAAWAAGDPLRNPVGVCWFGERLLIADPHAKAVFAGDREGRITRLTPDLSNR